MGRRVLRLREAGVGAVGGAHADAALEAKIGTEELPDVWKPHLCVGLDRWLGD